MASLPKIVCLTGGIGAGKTTVARFFEELGVPVYIADQRAKMLMENTPEVKSQIVELFGEEAYLGNLPNRSYLAQLVFRQPDKLQLLNSIIHPAVEKDFQNWRSQQSSPYVIKESAIVIESGNYKKCDTLILVTAPEKVRIERVVQRDNTPENKVIDRIRNQMPDAEKVKFADYVIESTSKMLTKYKVVEINNKILSNI